MGSGEAQSQTFLFADLAGYTALTEAHGDSEAADLAHEFCAAVREILPGFGAEAVKTIGDAVMIRADAADQAILLGLRITQGIGEQHRFPGVRVGMHTGPALERDSDWFGSTVNIAARISALAAGGEVLLSAATLEAAGDIQLDIESLGPKSIKNVFEPISIYRSRERGETEARGLPIDPICRMAVEPARAAAIILFDSTQYHFCSIDCANAFTRSPASYRVTQDSRSTASAAVGGKNDMESSPRVHENQRDAAEFDSRVLLRHLVLHGLMASFAGIVLVSLFLFLVFPTIVPPAEASAYRREGAILLGGFLLLGVPVSTILVRRRFRPLRAWLETDRPPTEQERELALRQAAEFIPAVAPFWILGALLFGGLGARYSLAAALSVGMAILLAGLATCALGYLIRERVLRPLTARALAYGSPSEPVAPGIKTRMAMAWTVASGIPLLGIISLALGYLLSGDFDPDQGFGAIAFLAVVAVGIGLLGILMATRSVAEPIAELRRALGRVAAGDFGTRTAVDDSSEVGLLQAGFNEMSAGLAERERIRETFGTYVDPEVAEHLLAHGASLAGEEVEVTVMFIDIRDFTAFAERVPAQEVVSALNGLWEKIVPIISNRSGHVDKFVGDGLLAVFGAPRKLSAHADEALLAALEISRATERASLELEIGIGLNSGFVTAGNVGGGGRLEFSVIGDVVNVAARVEAATRETGDTILITEHTIDLLKGARPDLVERSGVSLKGKSEAVRLFAIDQPTRAG